MTLPAPYFSDGSVTIYHGDCREILPLITADVMVTDPPYGMAYQSGWKKTSTIANDNTTEARDSALSLWGDRPALVFGRWSVPAPIGARERLIWDKGDWPGMGDLALPWGPSTEDIFVLGGGFIGKRSGQIIRDPKRPHNESHHPTEKPIGRKWFDWSSQGEQFACSRPDISRLEYINKDQLSLLAIA